MKRKFIGWNLLFFVLFLGFESGQTQDFLKHRNRFQLVNWKFHKGDIHSAESTNLILGPEWQEITVPHTWNAKDVLTDGDHYYQGIGWYRTHFRVWRDNNKKRYFIRFEGVSLVADVFLNGTYIGRHKGGYSAFCFEITPHILSGEENLLAVRVDNSSQPDVAPSGTHLYPLFGGIYRPVTIFSTDDLCISPLDFASSGVYIKPKLV
ncbi:MAG: beta galactosidase jelly roll domain-containing protein, partial [candidate division KSB1 bacterium]|nr:beta galactosidase jelly roll domain-containing protein [candidate division KSB1 bacterium]